MVVYDGGLTWWDTVIRTKEKAVEIQFNRPQEGALA